MELIMVNSRPPRPFIGLSAHLTCKSSPAFGGRLRRSRTTGIARSEKRAWVGLARSRRPH